MSITFPHVKNVIFTAIFMALLVTPSGLFAQTVSGTLTVATQPVSDVGTSWATLNGYASHPGTKITLWFEWGDTSSFGKVAQSKVLWGEGSSRMPIEGITSGTRYYYRAVAISGGDTRYGDTLSFVAGINAVEAGKENITAVTERPENLFDTSATFRGFATGENGTTDRWFEYGETASLGNRTLISTITNGYGTFSFPVTDLRANTIYFYRAAARGANNQTVYGVTVGFRTGTTPGSMGVYLGEGSTFSNNGSNTGSGQMATVVTSTKKTPTATATAKKSTVATIKKTDTTNCATTTALVGSVSAAAQGSGSAGLAAQSASSGGVGSLIVWLGVMAVILGIFAGVTHMMTVREEMRRKEANERMIVT